MLISVGTAPATLGFWFPTKSNDLPFLNTTVCDLGFTSMASNIDDDAQIVILYEDITLGNELARLAVSSFCFSAG